MNSLRQTNSQPPPLLIALCLVLAIGLSAGCGNKSKKGTLSGKVTYKGDPVTGGTITFYSADGKKSLYQGTISNDGTFTFADVPPGKMLVAIETESVKNQGGKGYQIPKDVHPPKDTQTKKPDVVQEHQANKPVYKQIPKKYAKPETSKLEVEVTKGKQEANFELTGPLP